MLSEISQRQILHGIPYMWKSEKNENKIQTHRIREWNGGCLELRGRGNRERLE